VQGPFIRSKWSHIPITFSQEDLQLKDYPHNDAMIISCVIKGFLVHNVLIDTGSAADIIFAKAFRQMQEPEDKIHDATHPLCGFGGRQIVALGKMTMSVTFGYVHNTRSEQVVFDIIDMEYPYNAIIGRGTLNAFETILHPAYLCMKIPSEQGPITVHGSQEAARRAEGSWTDSKAIHNIPKLEKYLDIVRKLEASFEGFLVKNIPRGENEHADLLAKSAAQGLPLPSEVFFETIKAPSVELMERAVLAISPVHSKDWRTEIISFLQGNYLSDDEVYNKRMEARTRPYVIIQGELYKHGVCSPLLKCLSRTEGQELMKEIHAGLCGSHIGSRPLLGKVFRQGFYWPKAASDAADLVQKCENCQRCARDQKQPSSLTQLIQPTWPLQRWGLNLLGPLPPAQGNLKYVVVAVEYFSKWIEAKPLATITLATV
jgi:hypothetical protein